MRQLPASEFDELLEWFSYVGEEQEKARKKAERESKRKGSTKSRPKPTKMGSKNK